MSWCQSRFFRATSGYISVAQPWIRLHITCWAGLRVQACLTIFSILLIFDTHTLYMSIGTLGYLIVVDGNSRTFCHNPIRLIPTCPSWGKSVLCIGANPNANTNSTSNIIRCSLYRHTTLMYLLDHVDDNGSFTWKMWLCKFVIWGDERRTWRYLS